MKILLFQFKFQKSFFCDSNWSWAVDRFNIAKHHRRMSYSLQGATSGVKMLLSLWNLTSSSAAMLPRRRLNFRATGKLYNHRSRDFKASRGLMMRPCNDHFVYAPSQWETTLQCHVVSHWLGAYTKLSLRRLMRYWIGPGFVYCRLTYDISL